MADTPTPLEVIPGRYASRFTVGWQDTSKGESGRIESAVLIAVDNVQGFNFTFRLRDHSVRTIPLSHIVTMVRAS